MYSDGDLTLAPFERADLALTREWVNDADLARLVDRVAPVTELEHQRWYEAQILRRDAVTFAIRLRGECVGLCGLREMHDRNRSASLWVYLGPAGVRGRGIGRRAVRLLCTHGFRRLNLHRIELYAAAYNEAAVRAYTACGFVREGRDREAIFMDGTYHDAVRMGLLRREFEACGSKSRPEATQHEDLALQGA